MTYKELRAVLRCLCEAGVPMALSAAERANWAYGNAVMENAAVTEAMALRAAVDSEARPGPAPMANPQMKGREVSMDEPDDELLALLEYIFGEGERPRLTPEQIDSLTPDQLDHLDHLMGLLEKVDKYKEKREHDGR
jgi:hypothetical protein